MLTGKTIGELPLLDYNLVNDDTKVPVEASGSTYHIPFSDVLHRPFASYIDTTTQSLSGANTPTVISFNTIVIESGITLTDLTKITVLRPGVYTVGISMQFDKTSLLSLEPIYIWTRVNGEDVPDSAGEIRLLNNNSDYNNYNNKKLEILMFNLYDALNNLITPIAGNTSLHQYD